MKFVLGLWLALLLNRNIRFKTFFRAVILLPYIVPTALSAIAFWWIYDSQFSIISWLLVKMGLIDHYIDFLGDPWNARFSVIAANVWRGVPFVAITLLAGLQTISPSYYEASAIDGATPWQQFRHVTLPLLTPIIAVVMTFSVLFTFTDFQLIYVHHPRRPAQRDAPDGDARLPARHHRRRARRGRGDRDRDGAVPARLHPVQLLRPAAARLAAGRSRIRVSNGRGRRRRPAWATSSRGGGARSYVYLPLLVFLIVLLFPFYWMAITSVKPDAELLSRTGNPFWVVAPTLAHFHKLLFET